MRRGSPHYFFETAPTVRGQGFRGIDERQIRLGVLQPGEIKNIGTFHDALLQLRENLSYLYFENENFWYDNRPTLQKVAQNLEQNFSDEDIKLEIENRVHKWSGRKTEFAGVHIFSTSADISDEATVRLVILPPESTYEHKNSACPAIDAALEISNFHGNLPRQSKNMLLFMAADKTNFEALKKVTLSFLAWQKIIDESEAMNLDALHKKQSKIRLEQAETARAQIAAETGIPPEIPHEEEISPIENVTPEKTLPTRFFMDVEFEIDSFDRKFAEYKQNIFKQFSRLPDAEILLRLDVEMKSKSGIAADIEETVSLNCETLNIKKFHFE